MWAIIEILREAAQRLPVQIGTTIGTVGGVVVGTAIVKAGIVSDIMIVAVTLTALGLFSSPSMEMAATWRWLFWLFIVVAEIWGVYGLVLATVAVIVHLTALENYGVPYLSPFTPIRLRDLLDSWIRAPFPTLRRRPADVRPLTLSQRQASTKSTVKVDLFEAQKDYHP
nr:spore germination protein [Sulfobacillus harzensis]